MELYTKEWFIFNQKNLENMYFKNGVAIPGIRIPQDKRTSYEVEQKAEDYEKSGKVDRWIAAWKMGRLDDNGNIAGEPDGTIRNGYGKIIKGLDTYLNNIDVEYVRQLIENKKLEEGYQELLKECPDNFGAVYIITLIHFISKGKIPIYDRFAHKAVKSIFANVNVNRIYVGASPDKKNVTDVMNLLYEYMWLLNSVFGTSEIDREIDRALWVYGHAGDKFEDIRVLVQ